jgi:hypothetical protein
MLEFELNKPIDISLCKKAKKRINAVIGIYKITSPTGKINIGKSKDIERRFYEYKILCCKGQIKIYNSLKKYGWKKHTFEIIHLCKERELNYWEDYYVNFFDTFNTPNGFNLKEGGNYAKLSDESIKRLSRSHKKRFNFLSYSKCKKWIQENSLTKKIKTRQGWLKITKKLPPFIPKDTEGVYGKQGSWKGWGDFLGTGNKRKGDFLSYEETKKWIQKNSVTKKIKNRRSWDKITKKLPSFIAKNPKQYYKRTGEWKGWGDFLSVHNYRNRKYLNYTETKKWVKKNNLTKNIKTSPEWDKIKINKLPPFIPKSPNSAYKKTGEWKGWGDFLGTKRISTKDMVFYNYIKTKKWIKNNPLTKNIKSIKEWLKIKHKLPSFIPKSPCGVYTRTKEWKSWGDFLGTKK